MPIADPKLKKIFDHISELTRSAYRSEFLLSSDILAKNIPVDFFLELYLTGSPIPKATFIFIAKRFLLGYVKNAVWFLNEFGRLLAFRFSGLKCELVEGMEKLIVIDVNFFPEKIAKEKDFKTTDFLSLDDFMEKRGHGFVYAPKLIFANLFTFYKALRILKNKKLPVLLEYQLVVMADFCKLFIFILVFPFKVIKLIKSLGNTREDEFIAYLLWGDLGKTNVIPYARFLYGRRISLLSVSKIKCISWYENQSADKNFYKGLRFVPGKVTIYGCQLFLVPENLLSFHPDENEVDFGIVPDKVLACGPCFIPKTKTKICWGAGPPLRYKRVFDVKSNPGQSEAVLVLLPYFEHQVEIILKLIHEARFAEKVLIKFHPATNIEKFRKWIKKDMVVVRDDLYDLFKSVRLVVGVASGSLVEAACMGIPVVNVEPGSMFNIRYFPDFGEGIIWRTVSSSSELNEAMDYFDKALRNDCSELEATGMKMREMVFFELSEESVLKSFDLI